MFKRTVERFSEIRRLRRKWISGSLLNNWILSDRSCCKQERRSLGCSCCKPERHSWHKLVLGSLGHSRRTMVLHS